MPIRSLLACAACIVLTACSIAPARDAVLEAEWVGKPASPTSTAVPYREVTSLQDIADAVAQLPDTTLVVFDIDDTLLSTPIVRPDAGTDITARRFFGSDTWYNWQKDLKAGDPQKVNCLFDVIAINYEAGEQQPVTGASALLGGITQDMIYLTSRSADARGGTYRELARKGLLPRAHPSMKPVFIPVKRGLGTFADGIFMTKGDDKGKILLDLIGKRVDDQPVLPRETYTDIVLIDDGWKNIRNMHEALAPRGIRYHGFLFTGIKRDPTTGSAADSAWPLPSARTRKEATVASKAWLAALAKTYPERARRIERNICEDKPDPS